MFHLKPFLRNGRENSILTFDSMEQSDNLHARADFFININLVMMKKDEKNKLVI